jgi:hypothetical protein
VEVGLQVVVAVVCAHGREGGSAVSGAR